MTAKVLMVQGTMSSAGKSLLVTGLCRLFARRGLKVAPFKAQNMSNNAGVCADGAEIGRAQYTQALACGIEPTAAMNPILLKPEADARSQVVVMGRPRDTLPAWEYYKLKNELWPIITGALDDLRGQYELVIAEGAGSPAELNLRDNDIVNMAVASYAEAPVLLIGDIDRGGIFAQLLGTLWLLEDHERKSVKGLLVNKFRGDPDLFADGIDILETRGGIPVLGVIPYLHNLNISEEDAAPLEATKLFKGQDMAQSGSAEVTIAVILLPRIANFDDFDPLAAEPGVKVRYVSSVNDLGKPHAVIVPGTKSTIADLRWLREVGLAQAITSLAEQGKAVVGVCGGYQMLGRVIHDPGQIEHPEGTESGLGLLPVDTIFEPIKATYQTRALVSGGPGWLASLAGQIIGGYEIHMGRSHGVASWLVIKERNNNKVRINDGAASIDGRVWGCYLHGLFANTTFRQAWLSSIGWAGGHPVQTIDQGNAFDHLADSLEDAIDMSRLSAILQLV